MNRWPLGARLTVWSVLIVSLALTVSILGTRSHVRTEEVEELDGELARDADHLLEQFRRHGSRMSWTKMQHEIEEVAPASPTTARYLILADQTGRILYRSNALPWEQLLQSPPGLSTTRMGTTDLRVYKGTDGQSLTYCFAADLAEVDNLIDELTRAHLLALPLVLAVAAFGGWWLARQALGPVKVIADAADAIRPEDLSARLETLTQRDDIGRLTRVFNRMLERLERGFHQATRFSADASHELRTPLTVLHTTLAALLDDDSLSDKHRETVVDLQLQTLGLISTTNALLLLARADAGRLQLNLETADFAEIVLECLEDARIVADQRGVVIECAPLPATPLPLDAARIRQVLSNLFDNAIKYNEPAGKVTIAFLQENQRVSLRIGNTGQGISDEARQRLFERFFRSAHHEDIPGTGLGLSLARELARAHGGDLLLAKNQPGWTEFELQLPVPALERVASE